MSGIDPKTIHSKTVDHQTLRTLLPHSGAMCLLQRVEDWDQDTIVCSAVSHRSPDNPLRVGAQLPVEAGIEYAAQAMAVHGSLCSAGSEPRIGYLAVLTKVEWRVQRLDDRSGDLRVEAQKLTATADGSHYEFSLTCDAETLLSGQAVIALADS